MGRCTPLRATIPAEGHEQSSRAEVVAGRAGSGLIQVLRLVEWLVTLKPPSEFRVLARAKGGGNPLGPPPSLTQSLTFEIRGVAIAA